MRKLLSPTDADESICNTSTRPAMSQLMAARMSRRTALKGLAAAGISGLAGCAGSGPAAGGATLSFTESGRFLDADHHVAPGYTVRTLIRWGDPLHTHAPAFDPLKQTAEAQKQQFGANNDYIAFMPLPRGSASSSRGLLCVNNEYALPHLMWPGHASGGYAKNVTRGQIETEMAAQGHSIVEIELRGAAWTVRRDSPYNRRLSALNTVMRIAGPAAGHVRMITQADPAGREVIGTYGNCAGGTTPWGTVLSAEENFHYSFLGNVSAGREAAAWKRMGIDGRGRNLWGRYLDRFNVDREPNEANRFGWIVEIDPYDPKSVPVKRTALGRFNHECANTTVSHDGRIAVYSGDDKRMEYVYKFVTRDAFDTHKAGASRDLLDNGTLYVARFEADGTMRWLPLVFGQGPLTPANGFADQGDVVIETRRAADLMGATPMDRPEDVEVNPASGRVYVVLTYNELRKPDQVDAANPRGPNRFGHIIEIVPPEVNGKPDHTATTCRWEFFITGGDPRNPQHNARYGNGNVEVSATGWIAAPDNVAFDPHGRIWIATDGQDDWIGYADSLYAAETSGPRRGVTRCLFSTPRGAECTGPAFTPDGKTLFVSVQHPADEKGSDFDKPSTRWPDFDPAMPPRSAVVAITRADGGEIGR
jgi:secreted PhoX family phosphatase